MINKPSENLEQRIMDGVDQSLAQYGHVCITLDLEIFNIHLLKAQNTLLYQQRPTYVNTYQGCVRKVSSSTKRQKKCIAIRVHSHTVLFLASCFFKESAMNSVSISLRRGRALYEYLTYIMTCGGQPMGKFELQLELERQLELPNESVNNSSIPERLSQPVQRIRISDHITIHPQWTGLVTRSLESGARESRHLHYCATTRLGENIEPANSLVWEWPAQYITNVVVVQGKGKRVKDSANQPHLGCAMHSNSRMLRR